MIDETQPKGTEHKERKIPGTDEVPLPQVPDFREGASWKIFRIICMKKNSFVIHYLAPLIKFLVGCSRRFHRKSDLVLPI